MPTKGFVPNNSLLATSIYQLLLVFWIHYAGMTWNFMGIDKRFPFSELSVAEKPTLIENNDSADAEESYGNGDYILYFQYPDNGDSSDRDDDSHFSDSDNDKDSDSSSGSDNDIGEENNDDDDTDFDSDGPEDDDDKDEDDDDGKDDDDSEDDYEEDV